jgi:alpha-L-fucosidase
MAGYDISKLVQKRQGEAHIESFFTRKGNDLYCIIPSYSTEVRIKNVTIPATTKATVLSGSRSLTWKQVGRDLIIDLSKFKPGEIPAELMVIKLQGAL